MQKSFFISILCVMVCFASSSYANTTIDSTDYYTSLSQYHFKIHNNQKAINYASKSLHYTEVNNDLEGQKQQHYHLGKLYYEIKKYVPAQYHFLKSVQLETNKTPDFNTFKKYYYLAFSALETEQWSKGIYYFSKADQINIPTSKKPNANLLQLCKATFFFNKKKPEIATQEFHRLLSQASISKEKNSIETAYMYLGILAANNKNHTASCDYLEKALALNKRTKNLKNKVKILLYLSKCHKALGDFDRAYSLLDEYHLVDKQLALIKNTSDNQVKFKIFKEKEKEKINQELIKERQKIENKSKYGKLINIIAIALISILSLLSFTLYKINEIKSNSNSILKRKNKELIAAKNKAVKASKARSEFLATVSHELRTPLNAINGITHLLLEEKPKKSQVHYLNALQFSANYLTNFIHEILEVNKIDSNSIQLDNHPFVLKELLENLLNSLQESALTNNNTLYLEYDDTIPATIIGDHTKLSQVFLNLISNAVKFTENGKIQLVSKLIKSQSHQVTIQFQIIDNGIGIPKNKHKIIFDNFTQGSIEINRKYGGTGLGLSIVKKIVDVLGGKIKVISKEGEGATFQFHAPFLLPTPNDTNVIPEVVSDPTPKKGKILIVEDNKINQLVIKKMVNNKGYQCDIVDDGETAVQIMQEQEYDLVLMDIHLPGIHGTEATKQIRVFNNKTPIIAVTAISRNDNRDMLLSYGLNEVINKPFIPEDFYTTIENYLNN